MDMVSLCRKRISADRSPVQTRRSPRLAAKPQTTWTGSSESLKGQHHGSSSSSANLPAISEAEDGSIILKVMVKPGAKQNAITDVGTEYVSIQIAALAREGQANYELVEYLASVLHLRRTDVTVAKGLRSKIKSVKITKDGFNTEKLKELLAGQIGKNTSV